MPVVGRGKVSPFRVALVRAHVLDTSLDEAYAAMRCDQNREQEATKWIDGLIGDGSQSYHDRLQVAA